MISIPISEMSRLRLRSLGRKCFMVSHLSMNFRLNAQEDEEGLP